jgi:hypothetical protein
MPERAHRVEGLLETTERIINQTVRQHGIDPNDSAPDRLELE